MSGLAKEIEKVGEGEKGRRRKKGKGNTEKSKERCMGGRELRKREKGGRVEGKRGEEGEGKGGREGKG